MSQKFKPYQRVVALDFLLNGTRRNVNCMIEGFDIRSNRYLVNVNSVIVYLPEEKLVDFQEYWDTKIEEQS